MDDILVCSPTRDECIEDTLSLLQFLSENGHKVSKRKLQICKEEVKYLGHNISQEARELDGQGKSGIMATPRPNTKKEMMQFLGMATVAASGSQAMLK